MESNMPVSEKYNSILLKPIAVAKLRLSSGNQQEPGKIIMVFAGTQLDDRGCPGVPDLILRISRLEKNQVSVS